MTPTSAKLQIVIGAERMASRANFPRVVCLELGCWITQKDVRNHAGIEGFLQGWFARFIHPRDV